MQDAGPDLFDTPPEPAFDRITELVAALLDAPVALLSLVDERRQFFKSMQGLEGPAAEARGTPVSAAFCRHVVEGDAALVVENAREHPLVWNNRSIEELGIVAYLGEPVRRPSGQPIGSLCAIGPEPRAWSARDRRVLRTLAKAVDAEIALREALARQSETLAALAAEKARAEQALEDRTRLFASLGHELRTPLNGVVGGLALAEATEDPGKRARFLSLARTSAESLIGFVDDLMAFARAGGAAPATAPFAPPAPLEAAIAVAEAAAAEKGVRLRAQVAPDLPQTWRGDAKRIERILVNLLGNAVKYAPGRPVSVSLAEEGGALVYRVADGGPGVPEADRERIFQPFDRGGGARADAAPGTGLGLAIAREAAEGMGATLVLEDGAAGSGAVFALTVPPA